MKYTTGEVDGLYSILRRCFMTKSHVEQLNQDTFGVGLTYALQMKQSPGWYTIHYQLSEESAQEKIAWFRENHPDNDYRLIYSQSAHIMTDS